MYVRPSSVRMTELLLLGGAGGQQSRAFLLQV
jgi:hypothetical protein